ncbi:ParB/RepB/Spo0J family partition protein [Silvanigrella sp.]|jgi:ParB/RepB/Spo0J family partition protein|uniref:ParB/RepB/Spo0J family partition protein n=1 Tax=Silvanigrella sp. TaxID=2024976 RepID=UPI0037C7FCEB
MSFKKMMKEKGSEMVRAAANEAQASKPKLKIDCDPKAISLDVVTQLLEEIKKNGKITSSVPISKIIIDENVRKQFSQENINTLGESLKDVGLLHNIILHIVEKNGEFYFHCVSGKRRVLAAELIGWEKIEADISLGENKIESLYIGAIANLHESVFWLDNANLYEKLFSFGNTDEQIATRVKVNPRTVGWFRRLAKMSPACQELANSHPELFNSRWAQQVARHGELPEENLLEEHMQQMIIQKRTWHIILADKPKISGATSIDKSEAILEAHRTIKNLEYKQLDLTKNFLTALLQSGFLSQTSFKKIQSEFFKEKSEEQNNLELRSEN